MSRECVSLGVSLLDIVVLLDLVLHVNEVVHFEQRRLFVYHKRHFQIPLFKF